MPARIIEQYTPGIVQVRNGEAFGSGFMFQQRGTAVFILTAHHVIDYRPDFPVYVQVGERSYTAAVVGGHSNIDAAVLSICCHDKWTTLPITPYWNFGAGWALVLARDDDNALVYRESRITGSEDVTKVTALFMQPPFKPGDSGAPVVDAMTGNVVGMMLGTWSNDLPAAVELGDIMRFVNEWTQTDRP